MDVWWFFGTHVIFDDASRNTSGTSDTFAEHKWYLWYLWVLGLIHMGTKNHVHVSTLIYHHLTYKIWYSSTKCNTLRYHHGTRADTHVHWWFKAPTSYFDIVICIIRITYVTCTCEIWYSGIRHNMYIYQTLYPRSRHGICWYQVWYYIYQWSR